jgi:hypothetical protein
MRPTTTAFGTIRPNPVPMQRDWQAMAAFRWCEDECMAELIFEVTQEADGGYCAECLTLDIFTQADTWNELRTNVREAVRAYFFDGAVPQQVRLHLVRDEVLAPL